MLLGNRSDGLVVREYEKDLDWKEIIDSFL
jgi:hypothetical protein